MKKPTPQWIGKIFVTTFLVLLSTLSFAGGDVEREELQRVLEEIKYVKNSLIIARNRVDEHERLSFNYDALASDLDLISLGISDYLGKARREPRELPELKGDYRHAR